MINPELGSFAEVVKNVLSIYREKRDEKRKMLAQTQKPIEEILEYLDGKDKVVLVGCGGYSTVFHTGGKSEVKDMSYTLSEHGKQVLAAISTPFGEFR